MAYEKEQREVGVDFPVKHRVQVKLDVGGSGERRIVAKDDQLAAVRYKSPAVLSRAVEKLLHQAVRAAGRSAGGTRRAFVDFEPARNQVNWDVAAPSVADRVSL